MAVSIEAIRSAPETQRLPVSLQITTFAISSYDQLPDFFQSGIDTFIESEGDKSLAHLEAQIMEDRPAKNGEKLAADAALNHAEAISSLKYYLRHGDQAIVSCAVDDATHRLVGFSTAIINPRENMVESLYMASTSDFKYMGRVAGKLSPVMYKALTEKQVHEGVIGIWGESSKLARRMGLNFEVIEENMNTKTKKTVKATFEGNKAIELYENAGLNPNTSPFTTSYHVRV